MGKMRALQVAVIGGSEVDAEILRLAQEVGAFIASFGAVVVCGGLGGVMSAVARGAKLNNGLTVGILPGYTHGEGNDFIDIAIPTGLGHARNVLVASSGDVVVALPGSHGTRVEISIALILGRPVYGLRAWNDIPGVEPISSVEDLKEVLLPKI